ncbi:lactate utilization protein C [Thermodesulfobacteriota bacterium]
MNDRDLILSRIRTCCAGGEEEGSLFEKGAKDKKDRPAPAKDYLVEMFREECEALSVDVRRAGSPEEVRDIISSIAKKCGAGKVINWEGTVKGRPDIEKILEGSGLEFIPVAGEDEAQTNARRNFIDIVSEVPLGLSGVDFALADSGTLVLRNLPGRNRSSSLLPPVYVALLEPEKILPGLEDLLERLQDDFERDGSLESCITLISGPSKTADIESTLVLGVHGPGEVYVVIMDF